MLALYIGGRAQGQTELAKSKHKGKIAVGGIDTLENIENADIVLDYHLAIEEMLKNNIDTLEFTEKLKCTAIVCDEVGCGIVPIDRFQEEYREAVGRCCCLLAKKADSVTRVVCGIGVRIK